MKKKKAEQVQRAKLDAARQKRRQRGRLSVGEERQRRESTTRLGKTGSGLSSRAHGIVRPRLGRPDWEDPEMEGAGQQACNDEASASGKSAGSTQI